MLQRINHIGIAVKDVEKAMKQWREVFGLETPPPHIEPDMKICMVNLGGVLVELMEPIGSEGTLAKSMEKRGEGLHHICYEVEDIYKAVDTLIEQGVPVVNKEPREGAEGKIIFLHPKATNGVLTEIVQVRK